MDDESLCGDKSTAALRKLRIKIKLPAERTTTPRSCDIDDHRKAARVDHGDEAKDDVVLAEEEEQHACSLCGKGFRSKKALGGHMRVHAQQQQQQQHRDDVVKPSAAAAAYSHSSDLEDEEAMAGAGEDGNKAIICPICDRDFPSNKALFGHMRCHPERSWRGIQPPPPPPVYSSSSTVSDVNQADKSEADDAADGNIKEQEVKLGPGLVPADLGKDLVGFGWGAKAIRGRAAITSNKATPPHHNSMPDPEQVDGVQGLILLSRGGTGVRVDSENHSKRHDDQLIMPAGCAVRDNFMNKSKLRGADKNHGCSGLEETGGKKRKNSQVGLSAGEDQEEVSATGLANSNKKFKSNGHEGTDQDHHMLRAADEHCGYNAASSAAAANHKAEMHKVRKYLMVDHFKGDLATHSSPVKKNQSSTDQHLQVAVNMELERYKCTTCNKCFSSHQALGGHKSSHNKSRNNNAPDSGRPYNDSIIHHPPRVENQYTVAAQCQGREAGSSHDRHLGGSAASISIHPLHQCNVCFKIYPSGQALGGHKRLHCSSNSSTSLITKTTTPPLPLPPRPLPSFVIAEEPVAGALPTLPPHAPSTVVTAPNQQPVIADPPHPQRAASADKGVFEFDLNELPSLEGEEAVAGAEQPRQ